jgi:hypothetical protein
MSFSEIAPAVPADFLIALFKAPGGKFRSKVSNSYSKVPFRYAVNTDF